MTDPSRGVGFTQGDVLTVDLARQLQTDGHLPGAWDVASGWVVLLSHPCDLASSDYDAEPVAEVILAMPAATPPNGNWLWAKSPRRLHIEMPGKGPAVLDLNIHSRTTIPRERLIDEAPDPVRQLPEGYPAVLSRWISQRYRRDALPDAFNERTRIVASKIHKALKKRGGLFEGLYVLLHTEEELGADDPYTVVVRATMYVEDYEIDSRRSAAVDTMDDLASKLGQVEGIEVRSWEVVSLGEMSLDDVRYFKRWDYDDLSYRLPSSSQPVDP